MSNGFSFFFKVSVSELEYTVNSFRDEFDILLKDTFSDDEINIHEGKIDSIAAIFVQPIMDELTFDDFYFHPDYESDQRLFFKNCKSSISFENIPYLESNPFQVTYFVELLNKFSNVLIDCGGTSELMFKEQFLIKIKRYKGIESLINLKSNKSVATHADPIDFLLKDIYQELERLKTNLPPSSDLNDKVKKIYSLMITRKLDGLELLRQSGLNAKDFGDGLERLKYWLKKF